LDAERTPCPRPTGDYRARLFNARYAPVTARIRPGQRAGTVSRRCGEVPAPAGP
jgi:hypothetical protein